jgi:hypothetical protein
MRRLVARGESIGLAGRGTLVVIKFPADPVGANGDKFEEKGVVNVVTCCIGGGESVAMVSLMETTVLTMI